MAESVSSRKLSMRVLILSLILAVTRCASAQPEGPEYEIEQRLVLMDLRARAARLVSTDLQLADSARALRRNAEVAGGVVGAVVISSGDARTTMDAVRRLRAASPHPLLVIVDLDLSLEGTTALPRARAIGALAPAATARAVGEAAALEAIAIGADLGLISLPPLNGREPLPSAARNPALVVDGIRAYAQGADDAGLPLLVRALWSADSLSTTLRWDRARLDAIELGELGRLVSAQIVGIALGSVRLPSITGDSVPLPFASTAIEGLLRRDLAFDGLVIADISRTSPLVGEGDAADAAVAAVAAGADLLLGADDPSKVVDALAAAVEGGRIRPERLEMAARRVLRLQGRLLAADSARPPRDSVGNLFRSPAAAELAADPGVRAAWETTREGRPPLLDSTVVTSAADAGSTASGDSVGESSSDKRDSDARADSIIWSYRTRDDAAPAAGDLSLRWPPAPVLRSVAADSVGMRPGVSSQIDRIMREALDDSVFSAAAVAVGRRGGLVLLRGYGRTGRGGEGDPVGPDETIFDLASLTKVIGTTTAVALLVEDGQMELDAPVERYLPGFDGEGKAKVRIRDLLTHTSGMPTGIWLFGSAGSPEEALEQVLGEQLLREPGERMDYSDLGMILLAEAAERAAGMPLDRFLALRVFAPLGMQSTMYLPPLALRHQIVPTAEKTEREFALQGVVHDANSFRLGGVAGHAGIFSTARDLAVFAQMMLSGGSYGSVQLLSPGTVREFTTKQANAEQRALGWDTPSRVSSAGDYFSARSFGHTGFTGTSLWVDPTSGVFVVLLTNRTYVEASAREILRLRSAVHDAAARAVADMTVRRRAGAR
jgi:CubicO group peptidase (beta-lactamase class C family)/beta-glucosidase-like glycosyl hydrolase